MEYSKKFLSDQSNLVTCKTKATINSSYDILAINRNDKIFQWKGKLCNVLHIKTFHLFCDELPSIHTQIVA